MKIIRQYHLNKRSLSYVKQPLMDIVHYYKKPKLRILAVLVATGIMIAYSTALIGCANTPTTYERSKEPRKVHDSGGRGRGA